MINIEKLLKCCAGAGVTWMMLRPEVRTDIKAFVSTELDNYNRHQAELERQRWLQEFRDRLSETFDKSLASIATVPIPSTSPDTTIDSQVSVRSPFETAVLKALPKQPLDSDAIWRTKIVHPSVVLTLGKRGSGKSALGYRLLEMLRYVADIYVVGVPDEARKYLPDWIGIAPSLEDLPNNCIALVDEAYLSYHARGSMTAKSKAMSQALNLSRQKEQTIIFISQDAGQIDRNILSAANVLIFKELGMLQLEFDRPQMNKLATQAKQALDSVQGNKKRWSYVYSPDANFLGLLENELPSFWKPKLSRLFAAGPSSSTARPPKSLTIEDRQRRALEMRAHGDSYGTIARELGVSRGTVVNYVKGYPYRRDTEDSR